MVVRRTCPSGVRFISGTGNFLRKGVVASVSIDSCLSRSTRLDRLKLVWAEAFFVESEVKAVEEVEEVVDSESTSELQSQSARGNRDQ
jgi:hypothetical protein